MAASLTVNGPFARGVLKHSWTGFATQNNAGDAVLAATHPKKTAHAFGTFADGTITMKGGNNTSTGPFAALKTVTGGACTLTSAAPIRTILENPAYIQPVLTTATTATGRSITVTVISHRSME